MEAPVTVLSCFADLGNGLGAKWLARWVILYKTQSGKKKICLPLWVFVKTTLCASQLESRPLPKSAKHDSTVTGASKTDPDNTRKSPQYGGQVSTPREALLRGFGEGREAGRGPKARPNLLSSPPSAGWSPARRPLTRAMPRGGQKAVYPP